MKLHLKFKCTRQIIVNTICAINFCNFIMITIIIPDNFKSGKIAIKLYKMSNGHFENQLLTKQSSC